MSEALERNRGGLLTRLRRAEPVRDDETSTDQQQQLLALWEKRNELKREFGRTLDELDRLKTAHAEVVARQARDSGRLAGLEAMLADPQRAQNAIIYYQLDALWKGCRSLMTQRRAALVEKFEQLEKQKLLDGFKANAVELQRQLEQKFAQYDSIYQEMAGNLKELQDGLRRSGQFWHYFRRKRLIADIAAAEDQVAPVVSQRDECLAELERVRDREAPAFKGLSVAAQREINLQLIALAQYLYVNLRENDLAPLARGTQEKQPGDVRYGTPQECLAMEKPIRDAFSRLKADDKRAERLKTRANYLRQNVQFAGNTDTVPESYTLGRIALSLGATSHSIDAARGDLVVNVLEQRYWGIDELLLRERKEK